MDDKMLPSSPDPLALSNEDLRPSPIKSSGPVITPRKPLASASGNARIQDFYISTPPARGNSKSPTKSLNYDASTSPWRIRLTLQAEQVDKQISRRAPKSSPAKRLAEHTTTVTVPLKGGDDTPPAAVKRGRGRPRKSLDSPPKRVGTPKPKVNRRWKTMPEIAQEQDDCSDSATNSPPKKTRGRPRESMEAQPNDLPHKISHLSAHTPTKGSVQSSTTMDRPTRRRSRARRKEITPRKVALNESVESGPDSSRINGTLPTELAEIADQRVGSYSSDVAPFRERYEEHHEQPIVDPTNEHQEYDTILESEGFSMVSVSSLASTSNHSSLDKPDHLLDHPEHTPAIASSPSAPPDIPDDVPQSSTRQLDKHQDGTPRLARVVRAGIALQGVLSPRDSNGRLATSPSGSRSCFQSLDVGEEAARHSAPSLSPASKSPKERLDKLFGGFGAGTRRELRAGLRLGEELAKRQRKASHQQPSGLEADGEVFGRAGSPRYPRLPLSGAESSYSLNVPEPKEDVGEEVVYLSLPRNQLPTPDRSESEADEDRMSWKGTTPIKSEHADLSASPTSSNTHGTGDELSGIDHSMMAREAEWQREREAVSRQIEMANKSQVIVIDSDDDEDDENREENGIQRHFQDENQNGFVDEVSDIWQAEAQSTDSLQGQTPEASEISLQPAVDRPRRSKLPNSWRRNSRIIYSDEVRSSDADLSLQPNHVQMPAKVSKKLEEETLGAPDHLDGTQDDSSTSQNQSHDQEWDEKDDSTGALTAGQLNTAKVYNKITATMATAPYPVLGKSATDYTTNSSLQFETSEERRVGSASMPATPENKVEDEPSEMIEPSTAAFSVDDQSILQTPQKADDESFAPIDPLLLQLPKQSAPEDDTKQKPKPGPRPPLKLLSESWLSYLTGPLYRLANPLPPPATKADILVSSPYETLCQLTPWESCHTSALGPLYYSSLLYGSHIFAFNPSSPSTRYLGLHAETHLGWSRAVTKTDCAVADAFMVLLDDRGFALGEPGEIWIDEGVVVGMCVELWARMCMRGEVDVQPGKGEVSGLRRGGDRMWVKERDCEWELCQVEYFERKRREFDGLPSWKEKGIVWPPR